MTSYEVNTVSPKVQYDRKELIRIFDEANNMLRGEGLRAGIERFGEFANILFLKLISESEQIKKKVEFKPSLIFPAVGIVLKKFHLQQELNILIIRSMIDLILFIVQTFLLRYKSEMRVY